MKSQESVYELLDQPRDVVEPTKEKTKFLKYARTKTTKTSGETAGGIICGNPKHRLYFCRRFRISLKPSEKRNAAQQLGANKRCLIHRGDYCRKTTTCVGIKSAKTNITIFFVQLPDPSPKCPAQEEFLSKSPPELAQQCQDAFCSVISRAYNSTAAERGLLEETVEMSTQSSWCSLTSQ